MVTKKTTTTRKKVASEETKEQEVAKSAPVTAILPEEVRAINPSSEIASVAAKEAAEQVSAKLVNAYNDLREQINHLATENSKIGAKYVEASNNNRTLIDELKKANDANARQLTMYKELKALRESGIQRIVYLEQQVHAARKWAFAFGIGFVVVLAGVIYNSFKL